MTGAARLVVGAGPAGLVAAATIARAGEQVTVLERHERVGQRFHGDFQGLENWSEPTDVLDRLAALGVTADFAYRPFHEVTFYDSRLRPVAASTDRPLFYLVRRGPDRDTLDAALLRQARAAGAEVRFGETARTAGPGTIIATGPRAADGIVSGYTFRTRLPDQAHAIVSRRLAPAGYAYLLLWGGRGTLATCLFRDLDQWRKALDETAAAFTRLVPGLDLTGARAFGGHGGVLGAARYADEAGRLYAGEAAGLQDPEWGFGMVHAMCSGALAGASLLDSADFPIRARTHFDPIQRSGFVNRVLFEALPEHLTDALLRHEAGHPDLRDRLARHWAPHPVKSLAAPLAIRALAGRRRRADVSCHGPTCTCVRCRHGAHASPLVRCEP